MTCLPSATSRRRTFWTTQPSACGEEPGCVAPCGIPGLVAIDTDDGRTFATNDWVRSLALNMLNTDARRDPKACGYPPGRDGGHWSDSYRADGLYAGTTVRDLPSFNRILDSVGVVRARLAKDMNKLVLLGVATSVAVAVEYVGKNRIAATIDITGPAGVTGRVDLTAERLENSWVWK